MRTRSRRESGQAAVETAIVMPLFVFIILSLIQLSLMHQARFLTKYAAYKAARAGSVDRAKKETMEGAAIAVMLPMTVKESPLFSGSGGTQPQYGVYKIESAQNFVDGWKEVSQSRGNKMLGFPLVELTVCHPLSSDLDPNKDFDDPATNGTGDWRKFENTKLSVQVTTYLNLIIPFANAFLWWASIGKLQSEQRADTMKMMRMYHDGTKNKDYRKSFKQGYTLQDLEQLANQGTYVMPVRASFGLRMHSNLDENANLPSENKCHVPFEKMN